MLNKKISPNDFEVKWADNILLVSRHQGTIDWFRQKLLEWEDDLSPTYKTKIADLLAQKKQNKTKKSPLPNVTEENWMDITQHLSDADLGVLCDCDMSAYTVVVGNLPPHMIARIAGSNHLRYFHIHLQPEEGERRQELDAKRMTELKARLCEYYNCVKYEHGNVEISVSQTKLIEQKSPRKAGIINKIKTFPRIWKTLIFLLFVVLLILFTTSLEVIMQELLEVVKAIECWWLGGCSVRYQFDSLEFFLTVAALMLLIVALYCLNSLKSLFVNVIVKNQSGGEQRKMVVMGLSALDIKEKILDNIKDFITQNHKAESDISIGLSEAFFADLDHKRGRVMERELEITVHGLPSLKQTDQEKIKKANVIHQKLESPWQNSVRAITRRLNNVKLVYLIPSPESLLQLPCFLNLVSSLFENTPAGHGQYWQVMRHDAFAGYSVNVDTKRLFIEKFPEPESGHNQEKGPGDNKEGSSPTLHIYSMGSGQPDQPHKPKSDRLKEVKERIDSIREEGSRDLVLLYDQDYFVDYEEFDQVYSSLLAAADAGDKLGYREEDICIDVTAGQKTFSIAAAVATMNRGMIYSYLNSKRELKTFDGHIELGGSYK